tara:strand:+ start:642 stop:758 length:117 start_codon:yes stop_codon:yes gene_type:complete
MLKIINELREILSRIDRGDTTPVYEQLQTIEEDLKECV